MGYVYIVSFEDRFFKIGKAKYPQERISAISAMMPVAIKVVAVLKSDDPHLTERTLHIKFKDKRLNGEWFSLSKEDIKFITYLSDSRHP